MSAQLVEAIRDRALVINEGIALSSGRQSGFYFNMKALTMESEAASLIADLLYEKVAPLGADYVGGMAIGAVPLISCLLMRSQRRDVKMRGFFLRREVKKHGLQNLFEGLAEDETLRDKKIVILDDVATTGGSAQEAIDAVEMVGGEIVKILAIVDREEGAREALKGYDFDSLCVATDFPELAELLSKARAA